MKKIITTPINDNVLKDIKIGDVIYLTGMVATCRDDGHWRRVEEGIKPDFDLNGMCILHAGPIVRKDENGWGIISIGPTTSMRMEKYEGDFIEETGVKVIIGKGGMGENTAKACEKYKAIHCVYPGGCAVTAAVSVERVVGVEWEDFGMPEALWIMEVKEFGPLIVTIDTEGNNLYEQNKEIFNKRKQQELERIVLEF